MRSLRTMLYIVQSYLDAEDELLEKRCFTPRLYVQALAISTVPRGVSQQIRYLYQFSNNEDLKLLRWSLKYVVKKLIYTSIYCFILKNI